MESIEDFDKFTTAIAKNDISLVKKLADKNNINNSYIIDKKSYTPLTLAIAYNYIDIIEELINTEGIDINKTDTDGNTALTLAINYNNIYAVKKLIERSDIDLNKVNNTENTPLLLAIINNNIEIVKDLLKIDGINVNQVGNNNITPIMCAVLQDKFEIVEQLLEKVDLDITKPEGNEKLLYEVILSKNNLNIIKLFVNYLNLTLNKNINSSLLLDLAIENNNSEIIKFLIENLNIEYLEQVKKENLEKLLSSCFSSRNNLILAELMNSSNPNFKEYISNNPNTYTDLVNLFYNSKNQKLIKELEKGMENKIDILTNEQVIKILENIRNEEEPNIKLFNLLLSKLEESERKKYFKSIKKVNQNDQGRNQVSIDREFIINEETNFIEIKDIAYARIKDKEENSKILYEINYNEDGSKTIIHYKIDKEEVLFTEIIKENEVIKIEFNENDFENINKESKNETERKNTIINYFRDETIKIYNINYKNIDAFDDNISRMSYAQLYLEEYLENRERNIILGLDLTKININNINLQTKNISEELVKSNNNKIEYISDKIIESSNLENKNKTFIFDLGYTLNPNKFNITNGNCGSHTTQIIILDGKAIMINTGGDKNFDKNFIKQINERIKEKTKNNHDSIKNFNNMFQLKEFGVCNVASKIYLNILFTEYKKKFGNLSKITENMYMFQKLIKNVNGKRGESEEFLKKGGIIKLNEVKELSDVVKNTNNIVKRNYGKYFSEENKEFTGFNEKLNFVINDLTKIEADKIIEQNI